MTGLSDKEIFLKRVARLWEQLEDSIEACLIEDPIDLYYLTGLSLSKGSLLLTRKEQLLLVDDRYFQAAIEKAIVMVEKDLSVVWKEFFARSSFKKIAFDSEKVCYERYLSLQKYNKEFIACPDLLKNVRTIKDVSEIKKITASAQLLRQGFAHICSLLKVGITEKELSKEFEIFCLQQGADGLAFEPIIAFGKNSAMPHYHSQNIALQAKDVVLIDIGVVVDHYHSDMTRVVFFKEPHTRLSHLYQIVKQAQKAALDLCAPGITLAELDLAAREVFKKYELEPFFVHSLGHGIGLDTHEFPRISHQGKDRQVILQKNMVVTIEPGLYLPDIGGVRYEDMVLITEEGYRYFYPIDPDE
ncbi:MAG: M24 family metallopeptidase [Candidatus Rhabdochlamydia sp.]